MMKKNLLSPKCSPLWISAFARMTLVLFISQSAFAKQPQASARFLQLGVGARESALGGAATAITNDVNSLYWNPAGLSKLKSAQLGFTHAEWILNTRYDFVGFAIPTKVGHWAVSGTHLGHKDQEGRSENRVKTGDFSASDLSMSAAYAKQLTRRWGVGTNLKVVESRIATDKARSVAVDLGTQYYFSGNRPLSLGASVRHLGNDMTFINQSDPLPLTLSIGVGKKVLKPLLLTGDWQFEPHDDMHKLIFGVEYQVISALSLRGAYLNPLKVQDFDEPVSSDSTFNGFVGGIGLTILKYNLDYAFTPFGALGETHRFSFKLDF